MNRDERGELRERIKAALRERGWTQQQLADEAGVALATVNNFLRGVSVPQFEKLAAIQQALGVEGDAGTTAESYPEDVKRFLLMMGAYLSLLPEEERLERIGQIVREIVASGPNG